MSVLHWVPGKEPTPCQDRKRLNYDHQHPSKRTRVENFFFCFRVCVLNDFQNKTTFIEYKQFGPNAEVKTWDISQSKGPKPEDQSSDSCIVVFVNFKEIGRFKDYSSAQTALEQIKERAPKEAQQEWEFILDF